MYGHSMYLLISRMQSEVNSYKNFISSKFKFLWPLNDLSFIILNRKVIEICRESFQNKSSYKKVKCSLTWILKGGGITYNCDKNNSHLDHRAFEFLRFEHCRQFQRNRGSYLVKLQPKKCKNLSNIQ